MNTFNRKACDSLNADKDCDELLHCIELEVVVDKAHPEPVVPVACLGNSDDDDSDFNDDDDHDGCSQ